MNRKPIAWRSSEVALRLLDGLKASLPCVNPDVFRSTERLHHAQAVFEKGDDCLSSFGGERLEARQQFRARRLHRAPPSGVPPHSSAAAASIPRRSTSRHSPTSRS